MICDQEMIITFPSLAFRRPVVLSHLALLVVTQRRESAQPYQIFDSKATHASTWVSKCGPPPRIWPSEVAWCITRRFVSELTVVRMKITKLSLQEASTGEKTWTVMKEKKKDMRASKTLKTWKQKNKICGLVLNPKSCNLRRVLKSCALSLDWSLTALYWCFDRVSVSSS